MERPMRREVVGVARVEERLRRDAADRDARAAHAIALDERHARPFETRVQRGDVAAGAAAEDRDVVRGHVSSLANSAASRSNGCVAYPCRAYSHRYSGR